MWNDSIASSSQPIVDRYGNKYFPPSTGGSSASWTAENSSAGAGQTQAQTQAVQSMATQSQLQQSKSTSNAQRMQQQIIASNIAQQKAKQQQYMSLARKYSHQPFNSTKYEGYAKNISSENALNKYESDRTNINVSNWKNSMDNGVYSGEYRGDINNNYLNYSNKGDYWIQETGKEIGSKTKEFGVSYVKGMLKAGFEGYRQDVGILYSETRNDKIKKELDKTSEKLGSWEDVKTAGMTTGAIALWNTPYVGMAIKGYFGHEAQKKARETIANPTPSNVADTILMTAPILPEGLKVAKKVYKKAGSTYLPPEAVFNKEVLSGKSKFPMTSSAEETIKSFEKTRKGEYM